MDPVALITGASSGIGKALADVFASEGYQLILVARTESALVQISRSVESTYGRHAEVIVKDLSERAAAETIFRIVQEQGISLDVLVNNAGLGDYGPFHRTDWDKTQKMLDVNITALTHLTRLFLPGMILRHRGHILNIASTAGFMPGPLMSVYYASKAYVLHFSEAVADELRGTGVGVTAFCPGPVKTSFQAAASKGEISPARGRTLATADEVARDAFNAMTAQDVVHVQGFLNYCFSLFPRFVPRSLVRRITHSVQERRG
ncbi:MAG: SDR family oxidoreductase [Bacteroidota bacterium]